jgi:uncharacterized protein (TIGR03435 family)
MPADAKPEFTVATIKPSRPDAPRGGYGIRGQDVTTTNVTVSWMIKLAYNTHAHQILGAPAWVDSERYDTVGRSDTPGEPSRDQMKLMIQKLLVDRFELKFHTEKKELPVYAMVVAKNGPKITVSGSQCFSRNRFRKGTRSDFAWPQYRPQRGGERPAEQHPGQARRGSNRADRKI